MRNPIQALDPRTKVLCALAIMVGVFFINTPAKLALGYAFTAAIVCLSGVAPSKLWRSVRPILTVVLVLSVFNLFFNTSGSVVWQAGPIAITTGGLTAAFLYSLRLVIGVAAAFLLLFTTTPTEITDAADSLLSPLAKLGLPAHELAMVFSLMLRFIPTIADEAKAIIDAQTARGGAIGEGSLVKRLNAIIPILVALLAGSVRHAGNLSRALDARNYAAGAERSHWHPLKYGAGDAIAAAVCAAFIAALIIL